MALTNFYKSFEISFMITISYVLQIGKNGAFYSYTRHSKLKCCDKYTRRMKNVYLFLKTIRAKTIYCSLQGHITTMAVVQVAVCGQRVPRCARFRTSRPDRCSRFCNRNLINYGPYWFTDRCQSKHIYCL